MHLKDLDVSRLPRNTKETVWLEVAQRADGGHWQLPFLYVTGSTVGPILLVLAAVHGDEYEGVEAIPRIFRRLTPDDLCGTLLMVPICNVPAYGTATRNSTIDGKNLARVFPGDAHGTITEQIACFLTEKLLKSADFLIDLHSGGIAARIPTLIGYIRSDDERGKRTLAGAEASHIDSIIYYDHARHKTRAKRAREELLPVMERSEQLYGGQSDLRRGERYHLRVVISVTIKVYELAEKNSVR